VHESLLHPALYMAVLHLCCIYNVSYQRVFTCRLTNLNQFCTLYMYTVSFDSAHIVTFIVAALCRYNVHKPLINFMAPFTSADVWSDEQR